MNKLANNGAVKWLRNGFWVVSWVFPIVGILCAVRWEPHPLTHGSSFEAGSSLNQLLHLAADNLWKITITRANLLCAEGLSIQNPTDISPAEDLVKSWAQHVKAETDRHWYHYQKNQAEYENSPGFFRMLMLAVVLVEVSHQKVSRHTRRCQASTSIRVLIAAAILTCVGYFVVRGLGQVATEATIDPITGLPAEPQHPRSVKFGNIVLEAAGRDFRLSDLYETAADWVSTNEHAPLEVRTNVGVRIFLQHTNALCRFTFTYPHPFGRNMWMITMGKNGTIAGCFKAKVGEGTPPGITTPPPPPDKFGESPPKRVNR